MLAIGVPIIAISAYLVIRHETKANLAGHPNDKGGTNYFYRESSGLEALPNPVGKFVKVYPNSEVTYLNVSTDAAGKLGGSFTSFTKDPLPKVLSFYKEGKQVKSENNTEVEIVDNNQEYRVLEQKVYEYDPIEGQTKFEVYFYSR